MSDGEALSQGRTSRMLFRFILAISYGDTESTLVGDVDGAGLGCLIGGESKGAGFGAFLGGLDYIRESTLSRDKGFLVRRALDGRGSA